MGNHKTVFGNTATMRNNYTSKGRYGGQQQTKKLTGLLVNEDKIPEKDRFYEFYLQSAQKAIEIMRQQ
jgi:hypothetical protein